ncbi:MAG: peptide-methionine (S)-S-oxide reductase MsrA [Cryomorphaceae bacterium]|jgi:peptide-methionine (S)-S-oxide reductase|nr:peptide-methionine (S)-S-oxide reductase MsrA [Cryomorphaceae bacterium]MBT3503440.1 peptide-methionine (S)-S-oxide reductase MsrA [Cryomorphaceae bacterium]MBT3688678.1 peptide-methionine (S)-S-oxide reductase MsrA [Cryomorphaceae bacterium]MBT4222551.1 peptide-methionine (S)-S-oxide reductase MsrA [Cryomorphaceae bacterium]MBT4293382.1 peptide-methionine (S)-S-oxide reductase MsrA [Cryomorphaceae bacterium]
MNKYIFSFFVFFLSCDISSSKPIDNPDPVFSVNDQDYKSMNKAYFASGCFWCVETIYESLDGVKEVYSGYAGGSTINPNYYQVMSGKTGHAEAIEIIYDENVVSFDTLLKVFFDSHNPTTPNRQGPDYGTQYRSIAFYSNEAEMKKINNYIDFLSTTSIFGKKIITEIEKIDKFYYAEDYHQDYEKKNPNNPYIQNVSIPRFKNFKQKASNYVKVKDDH